VRVLIVRQPVGNIDGIPLAPYKLGQSYDLPPILANYLVAQGFGVFDEPQGESAGSDSATRQRPQRR
jgi:hypothetical protein